MTLAAPPEKMTNAEDLALKFIEALGATVAHSVTLNRLEVLTIAREAARRLSAPAPAAPRVGDGPPREPTEEMWGGLARDLIMWRDMSDRPTGKSLYEYLRNVGREAPGWLLNEIPDIDHVPPKGTRAAVIWKAMWDVWHGAALSAPPAASADERETMAEEIFSGVHPRWMWKTWTDEGDPETYGRKQFRAMADAALGYRKRAAQGVGTDIEAGAARVHLRYLSAAKRLGWTIRPGLDVPYEQLSEAAKEIDRETYRAAIAGGDDE